MSTRAKTRYTLAIILTSFLLSFLFVSAFRTLSLGVRDPEWSFTNSPHNAAHAGVSPSTLGGATIAPHLGNATAKAALGRSSWHLFHTMLARFPVHPTADESTALQSWLYLFARLYPCGECAGHFQEILRRFPPQVSGREVASRWGCHVHNEVSRGLGKGVYDCSGVEGQYDCGCGEDEKKEGSEDARAQKAGTAPTTDRSIDIPKDEREPVALKGEERQKGG